MSRYALMVEYKIKEEHLAEYSSLLRELQLQHPEVQLFQGTDQPGLYVEIWPADSEEEAAARQEERLDGRSAWKPIGDWTAGEPGRIHAWTFKPAL
ncbi:hypothetical protein M3223_12835 [Paenibacillus pasadenensis]|uniref:hypothetical protein n=1 Tax=Paenibacillus pasadenensis TaxID=217090 RepID=UPI00203F1BF3|nr:hypothetical protein [Paenibacillus pasadenensis]MCM3748241.1 hypothetical protein [Paenibacillus pasadenensis]